MGNTCCFHDLHQDDYISRGISVNNIHKKAFVDKLGIVTAKINNKSVSFESEAHKDNEILTDPYYDNLENLRINTFHSLAGHEQWFRDYELKDLNFESQDSFVRKFQTFLTESEESGLWTLEQLKGSDKVKIWGKWSGTDISDKFPLLRIDCEVSSEVTIDKIIKATYNFEERKKWDNQIDEKVVISNEHPNMEVNLIRNTKILFFTPRQFFEKNIVFRTDCYEGDHQRSAIYTYH